MYKNYFSLKVESYDDLRCPAFHNYSYKFDSYEKMIAYINRVINSYDEHGWINEREAYGSSEEESLTIHFTIVNK